MEALGLSPGPKVGALIAEMDEKHAAGELSTREEALAWLRRLPAGGQV